VADAVRQHEQDGTWADALSDALTEAAHGALNLGEPQRALWAVDRAEPLALQAGRGKERMELDAIRAAAEAAVRTGAASAAPRITGADHPIEMSVRTAVSCVALLSRRTVAA
jgi:hypothetical protein